MLPDEEGSGMRRGPALEVEMALLEEYLGRPLSSLKDLPPEQAKKLLANASLRASLRLEELRARAQFVGTFSNTPRSM
jgi:hypothetical protein